MGVAGDFQAKRGGMCQLQRGVSIWLCVDTNLISGRDCGIVLQVAFRGLQRALSFGF